MNDILSEQLISIRELALFIFALFLLAATPAKELVQTSPQQPVNVTVPADQKNAIEVKSA